MDVDCYFNCPSVCLSVCLFLSGKSVSIFNNNFYEIGRGTLGTVFESREVCLMIIFMKGWGGEFGRYIELIGYFLISRVP